MSSCVDSCKIKDAILQYAGELLGQYVFENDVKIPAISIDSPANDRKVVGGTEVIIYLDPDRETYSAPTVTQTTEIFRVIVVLHDKHYRPQFQELCKCIEKLAVTSESTYLPYTSVFGNLPQKTILLFFDLESLN
jgi:hypothetical protein